MTHVTCRLTAKNRLRSGTIRLTIEYELHFLGFVEFVKLFPYMDLEVILFIGPL